MILCSRLSRLNRPHFVEKSVERRGETRTDRDPARNKPAMGLRRSLALALLCAAQFMVVLDFSIVNVALPAIEEELGFSREGLQWVIIPSPNR